MADQLTMDQSSISLKSKTDKPKLPFDLNDLCNLQFTFDVLRNAIEYLA